MPGTLFRMVAPIRKATADMDSGEIIHEGVASDESVDLEGDRISTDLVEKSFPYLEQHGKHNWNHNPTDIGDVLSVARATPDAVMDRFGLQVEGAATVIKGNVYPLVNTALAPADLITAHHRLLGGARLGYSLHGVAIRKASGEIATMIVPRIAIAPQAINTSAMCRVVKSFDGALASVDISDDELPGLLAATQMVDDEEPELLIDAGFPMVKGVVSDKVQVSRTFWEVFVRAILGDSRNAPIAGSLRDLFAKKGVV